MKKALYLVACLVPLTLCLSTCIKPHAMPEALDPALVEAEILKAKGVPLAKAEPGKEPLVAMAETPKEPAPPKAEAPKEPTPPKPETPKEPTPPKPETPKEPTPPKPEAPKEPAPPKPETPKEPTPPKPETPKELTPPKPEMPKEFAPPKPEVPKEPAPPKPEPPKDPTPPKPETPKEPTPPKPETPKEPTPPKPETPKDPAPPKPEPPRAETPKEPTPPKPEAPKEPTPPKPEPPKPVPPKEPVPPKIEASEKLFLFSPVQRKCFAAGETAEYTLVIIAAGDVPQAAVTLTVTNEAGDAWTATDPIGPLSAGRHSLTYGVEAGSFAPGTYKVGARLGEQASNPVELVVAQAVPRTHFRLAGWLEKPPRAGLDVHRWSALLGLNTVGLQNRSAAGSESTLVMDDAFVATSRGMRAEPNARPIEEGLATPPFIQTGELLTSVGLEWMNACAVGVDAQGRPAAERDPSDPQFVRSGRARIHQLLQAERRFRNCAGALFTDETLLPRAGAGDAATPFGVPAQLAAYKKFLAVKDVPWQKGSQAWDEWYPYQMFRFDLLGDCLASWAAAAQAVSPAYRATALLHPPTRLADGAYPPLAAKGLPIITATATLNGPAGMMMPAVATDLLRMGNWGKGLWFMPEIADDADLDEIRAAVSLAVARKVDGVLYPKGIDYLLDRPAIGPGQTKVQGYIAAINQQLTQLGDFLLALEKPRDDVAILYSVTEHIERMGRDPVKNPDALSYPWTLIAAYNACFFAHFPCTFITEEELVGSQKPKSKVILAIGLTRVRPEVKGALDQHVASGGVVLTDTTTKVAIEGAKPLGFEFPDLNQYLQEVQKLVPSEKVNPELERRDAAVQAKVIYPLLGQLRTELKASIDRDYTSADPDIIVCDQKCGQARYVFMVNNTQRTDLYRGLKWELAAAQTRLTLREGNYAVYEAVEGKRLYPMRDKGHPTLSLILPPGALRIFALLPEGIHGVRISSASLGRDGLAVAASVHGQTTSFLGGPRPLNAAVPIEVVVTDPAGRDRLRVCRAHTPGGYKETLALGRMPEPGTWTLTVTELLSRQKATATFRVSSGATAWVSRRGPLAVFDGDRIAALLRGSAPLSIVVGTEEESAKAEALAAALRTLQRTVEVKFAGEVAKPAKASPAAGPAAAPASAPTGDGMQNAILLGQVASNPLLRQVHNSGVLPRTVTPDYPGPGGALLCSVLSALTPDGETVVAAAADPAGVDAAIQALLAATRGGTPQVAWQPLASGRTLAAVKPSKGPRVERLAFAWQYRASDVPTSSAVPLQGGDVTIGFYDGLCMTFNRTGKEVWRRRCTTRIRAVARSLDGVWAALGSFPELVLVSAQGRLQFATVTEPGPRADYTAVAISPDGTLTLAGTRQGGLIAYDLQGNIAFGIGIPEPEKPAEAEKPKEPEKPKELPKPKEDGDKPKEPEKPKESEKPKEGDKGSPGEKAGEGEKPKEPEKPRPIIPSRLGCVNDISISFKTGNVVAGGEAATMAFDPKGQELWTSTELNRVASVACSYGEEQTVAVGTRTGVVACVTGGTTLWRNQAEGPVMSVCFRGETAEILAASLDGTLACYDKNGKALWTKRSPVGFRFVASSLDGALVAAAETVGRVFLFNKAGQLVAETPPIQGAIRTFAFTPDGERIIVGTATGEVLSFKYKRAVAEQDEL